jgi:hypothetical protein
MNQTVQQHEDTTRGALRRVLSLLWALSALVSVLYILIFMWFYAQYGWRAVGWHTHLIYPVILAVLIYAGIIFILEPLKGKPLTNLLLKWFFLMWLLWVGEVLVMLNHDEARSNNLPGFQYIAPFNSEGSSFYHVWPENAQHFLKNSEFSFSRKTNSLGFPDKEWSIDKEPGTIRILCLGDSFTEGDGADDDSSYVAFLRRKLSEEGLMAEVMNAGTCGSDPVFNFKNLEDRLWVYKPDIIVQTISHDDIFSDIAVRGGMERFKEDGQLRYRKAPWWEPLYAVSHIFRAFVHSRGVPVNLLPDKYSRIETYESMLLDFFEQYANSARLHHAQLMVVLLPLKRETSSQEFGADFSRLSSHFEQQEEVVWLDLLPCYRERILASGKAPSDFYWKIDGHHNSEGYQMMADCIFYELQKLKQRK